MSIGLLVDDPALPQMADVLDPARMTEHLTAAGVTEPGARVVAADVLKHKHGKRCSVAFVIDEPTAGRTRRFAKAFKTDRGAAIAAQRIGKRHKGG